MSPKGHPQMVIIGLDGATFRVLNPMRRSGVLPHLSRLMDQGAHGVLRSTIPTNSAAAWVSFMTGRNPGKHGVFEFQVQPAAGSQRRIIASSRCIAGETLWQILSRHGLRQVVVNVPITYPPQPINGVMVSGIPIPGGSRSWTYPEALADELRREVGEYIIGTPWRYYLGRPEPFLDSLTDMTRRRAQATRYLLERYEPDVLTVVFVGPDRLQHCLWQYLDPSHLLYREREAAAHRGAIEAYFRELDQAVGLILAGLDEETSVLVLSDHGFQAASKQLALNEWLAREGLLAFRQRGMGSLWEPLRRLESPWFWRLRRWYRGHAPQSVRRFAPKRGIDWARTKAYAAWGHQEGLAVNLAGREPQGIVQPDGEYAALRTRLRKGLEELRDPKTGQPVVRQVLYREEYYHGPFAELAADVILVPEDGFSVSPPPHPNMLFRSTGWASGGHQLDGILIAAGGDIQPGAFDDGPTLVDIAPTVLYMLGLPIPRDMDGRVLGELFSPARLKEQPPLREEAVAPEGNGGRQGFEDVFSEAEERDVQEKLRGLGYLG